MMKAYLLDRLRHLKPRNNVVSPVSVLSELEVRQWLYLLVSIFIPPVLGAFAENT